MEKQMKQTKWLVFSMVITIILGLFMTSITTQAYYDGDQGSVGGATGAVSGGPTYMRTACLFYLVSKDGAQKVTDFAIIAPRDVSGEVLMGTCLYPRYFWLQGFQKFATYNTMPYPIAQSGLAPNGLAVRRWLEQKTNDGREVYWRVIEECFTPDVYAEVSANAEDYVVCIETVAWYNSPAHGRLAGTARGLGLLYSQLGDPEGANDTRVRQMAFESVPMSMIFETAFCGVPAPTKTSGRVTNAMLQTIGYGIHRIELKGGSTHTWDYDLAATPGAAPEEPGAQNPPLPYKIIKGYRTKLEDGTLTEPYGAFHRDLTYPKITIEDETDYHVIQWDKSTTEGDPDPLNWNPPGVTETGTSTGTITLDQPNRNETVLYVLLEKEEKEEPEELPETDYVLHESHISKVITTKKTDKDGTNLLEGYEFIWTAGKVNKCPGHTYYTACTGHGGSHNDSRPSDCKDDHTWYHSYNCVEHTEYCSNWKWTDGNTGKVKLYPKNSDRESYPTILPTALADKMDRWEPYPDSVNPDEVERTTFEEEKLSFETGFHKLNPEKIEYRTVIYRGADKLSPAEFCNSADGISAQGDVELMGFVPAVSKTTVTRKTKTYTENFNITASTDLDLSDIFTQATGKAAVTGKSCVNDNNAELEEKTVSTGALVEVYSGTANRPQMGEITQKSTEDAAKKGFSYGSSGNTIVTGKKVLEPVTVSFNPFIRMQYNIDLENPNQNTAGDPTIETLVLSEYQRSFTPISYAQLKWTNSFGSTPNVNIRSAQWSTHASATKRTRYNANWAGANQVLPGGAIYTLDTDKSYPIKVEVKTWQWVIEDGCSKEQFNSEAVDYYTMDRAKSEHEAYVKSVQSALEALNLEQWVDSDPSKSNAFGGQVYETGAKNTVLDNGVSKFSTESKYSLIKMSGAEGGANEADLDTKVNSTSTSTYKYYADTQGNIYCGSDGTVSKSGMDISAAPSGETEQRTMMGAKLIAALERNTGNDPTAKWAPDGKWYNEGMNPITCVIQTTVIEVGLKGPDTRTVVLDPKTCPRSTGKGDVFTAAYITQYKTQPYSLGLDDNELGTFKGKSVYTLHLDEMFWSRPFYIPNTTVQDLS